MKLYADYIKEREGFETFVYNEIGFVTYKFIDDFIHLGEVYVVPEKRVTMTLVRMMDEIVKIARGAGMNHMAAKVYVETNNPALSLRNALSYGFKIVQAHNNEIVLAKEI